MFEPQEKEPVKCPQCGGDGGFGDARNPETGWEDCFECGGSGEVSPFQAVRLRANRIANMADDRLTESKL